MGSPWNDQTDELLKEGRSKGVSYTRIAKTVTAAVGETVSRSAAIGRAKRLGLSMGAEARLKALPHANLHLRMGKGRKSPDSLPVEPAPNEGSKVHSPFAKPWLERVDWTARAGAGECAWPIDQGDRPADALSCCNPCGKEGYCLPHLAIMWPRKFSAAVHRADSEKAAANQTSETA